MLPILWTLVIPAGWAGPLAVVVAALLALLRAADEVHRARRAGEAAKLGQALWRDRFITAFLLVAALGLWRSGLLVDQVALPIYTYGLLIAVGVVLGIVLAQREARRQGLEPDRIADLAFWLLLSAVVGSHLFFAAVNVQEFFSAETWLVEAPWVSRILTGLSLGLVHVERIPRILVPEGLVFYGGFLAAASTAVIYLARNRLPLAAYGDTLIPSLALGHCFGRLGCFAAGCCWGAVGHGHLPWLVAFPPGSAAYEGLAARPGGVAEYLVSNGGSTLPLHPTQLYEAAGELVIFFVLVALVRPRKRFHGQVLAAWLLLYALLRTGVELFRGDVERGVFAGLGVGQWTSMAVFVAGVAVWVGCARRRSGEKAPSLDSVPEAPQAP
jgi:phosphatidylglycerol:prolipoprotein diacylglycerol transferase